VRTGETAAVCGGGGTAALTTHEGEGGSCEGTDEEPVSGGTLAERGFP